MRIPKHPLYKAVRAIVSRIGISRRRPVVISFTGGMGAQIISVAIYMDLKLQGDDVYADFRYFEEKPEVQQEYSVWDWQLDCYGLTMDDFKRYQIRNLQLLMSKYIRTVTKKHNWHFWPWIRNILLIDFLNILKNLNLIYKYY
jgi:hypothetical protein